MPLEYQRGSVYLQGKRRKAWYGKYRTWCFNPASNTWVTKHKTKKIGLKSELTKFEAEGKLRDIIAADNAEPPVLSADSVPAEPTLEWFVINRHFPMMACGDTSRKKTQYEIRRYVLKQFGGQALKAIGLFELQTHLNRLAQHFSDSIVRHSYVNIRSIFNNAVELDFLVKNPAKRLNMPDTRLPDKSILQPTQIMELLENIDDSMDRCAFSIGVFCALRTSELFGLTWGCWLGDCLAITHTAFEGHLQENKVKTCDSRALVPVPDLVQPIIRNWHAVCTDASAHALMFPTTGKRSRKGQEVPFDSTNFMEHRVHPIADRLGIPRRLVTFQVMRRTVGTDLQFHGTLKDAQAALRHKSAKTTADIYMQPVSQSVRAALNARTEAVFRSRLESRRSKY